MKLTLPPSPAHGNHADDDDEDIVTPMMPQPPPQVQRNNRAVRPCYVEKDAAEDGMLTSCVTLESAPTAILLGWDRAISTAMQRVLKDEADLAAEKTDCCDDMMICYDDGRWEDFLVAEGRSVNNKNDENDTTQKKVQSNPTDLASTFHFPPAAEEICHMQQDGFEDDLEQCNNNNRHAMHELCFRPCDDDDDAHRSPEKHAAVEHTVSRDAIASRTGRNVDCLYAIGCDDDERDQDWVEKHWRYKRGSMFESRTDCTRVLRDRKKAPPASEDSHTSVCDDENLAPTPVVEIGNKKPRRKKHKKKATTTTTKRVVRKNRYTLEVKRMLEEALLDRALNPKEWLCANAAPNMKYAQKFFDLMHNTGLSPAEVRQYLHNNARKAKKMADEFATSSPKVIIAAHGGESAAAHESLLVAKKKEGVKNCSRAQHSIHSKKTDVLH
jgi:hypothetical protein